MIGGTAYVFHSPAVVAWLLLVLASSGTLRLLSITMKNNASKTIYRHLKRNQHAAIGLTIDRSRRRKSWRILRIPLIKRILFLVAMLRIRPLLGRFAAFFSSLSSFFPLHFLARSAPEIGSIVNKIRDYSSNAMYGKGWNGLTCRSTPMRSLMMCTVGVVCSCDLVVFILNLVDGRRAPK